MSHSTVTSKGQTTIPRDVRQAMRIKPGDKLVYSIEGDHVRMYVHAGTMALKGALASEKGRNLSFAEIRDSAASKARKK